VSVLILLVCDGCGRRTEITDAEVIPDCWGRLSRKVSCRVTTEDLCPVCVARAREAVPAAA